VTDPGPGVPTARRTPYELVFTSGAFESEVFPRIRAEAEAEDVDTQRRERFEFLTTAADIIRQVVPEDAPPEALEQYRAILFHAFHFWRGGRRLYVLEPPVARYLVEASPMMRDWDFTMPAPSLYLQLPPQLFWGSISPDSTPEPVDGFFVTASEAEDPLGKSYAVLDILVVLGIRRSRAGFSVIPLVTELGPGIPAAWLEEEPREGGDFSTVLPGGELAGLYSILTAGEVLKLVARALWYADRFDESLVEVSAPEARGDDAEAPPHTRLGYTLLTLAGESAAQEEEG
jgi:hypothetical protein